MLPIATVWVTTLWYKLPSCGEICIAAAVDTNCHCVVKMQICIAAAYAAYASPPFLLVRNVISTGSPVTTK